MHSEGHGNHVLAVTNLTEYFRDALRAVLADQHTAVEEPTEHYVVTLLTRFSRVEQLRAECDDEARLRPLALIYAQALEARTATERDAALQRLGDLALFLCGFFGRGLERSRVDVDYHMAMGTRAYDALSDLAADARLYPSEVFAELAAKFRELADALAEIADSAYVHSQRDILRLYELWLRTGSERARRLLRRLGVEPAPGVVHAH